MQYQYLYLLLGSDMCIMALIVGLLRKDLWRPIIACGLFGACLELFSEVFYLQDYWKPFTVFPTPWLEDLLYGFGVTALAACAYPFWLRKKYVAAHRPDGPVPVVAALSILSFLLAMLLLMQATDIQSIWSACLIFAAGGIVAAWMRSDLAIPALVAGIIMGVLALVVYGVGLNYLIDGDTFLDVVLLQNGTPWDIRILGNVPLDEIVWNITRGWCVAALYPLVTGMALKPLRE